MFEKKNRNENETMPRTPRKTVDRIQHFRQSWKDVAPEATFAGMTLAQFEAATEPPIVVREEIATLEIQLRGKIGERSTLDEAANELLDMVVNSVKGTPGFGPNSPMYRALGYVPKNERRSGLSRKRQVTPVAPPPPAEDADAA